MPVTLQGKEVQPKKYINIYATEPKTSDEMDNEFLTSLAQQKDSEILEQGNIDLNNRPVIKNPDGTVSTEISFSFKEDGKEVLIPTIWDGKRLSEKESINMYRKTGQHMGKFSSINAANQYAEKVHNRFNVKPSLSQEEMNIKRNELLNAGFNNVEIDEYFGIESPPDWQQKFSQALTKTFNLPQALGETAGTLVTGTAAWLLGKTAGSIVGLSYGIASGNMEEGTKIGRKTEEKIAELITLAPQDPQAKELVQTISYILDNTVGAIGRETGDMMANAFRHSQLAPWIRYVSEFGTELFLFKSAHIGGKKVGAITEKGISKVEKILSPKEKADIITEHILKDKTPEEVIAGNRVKKYTSSYPDAKPEEFFSKSAEESLMAMEDTARTEAFQKATTIRHEELLSQLKSSIKETGKSIEESVRIFDSTESKLQELDIMINEIKTIGEEVGYGNLKSKLSVIAKGIPEFDSKILKTLPPDEATATLISYEINKLNDLRKTAEEATGANLKSFYDKAIDDTLEILPKEIKDKTIEKIKEPLIKIKSVIGEKKITPEITPEGKGTELELTPDEIKTQKVKPIQKDMLGIVEGTMEGKIPSVEIPETVLERSVRETETRKVEAEMAKRQIGLPEAKEPLTKTEYVDKAFTEMGFDPDVTKIIKEKSGNLTQTDFNTLKVIAEANYKRLQEEIKPEITPKALSPTNIITWIKSKGGIDYLKEEWGGEIDIAMENQPSLKSAVNKKGGGLTLDELAMMAKEEGFIKEANPQALLDAIETKELRPEVIEKRTIKRLVAEEAYEKAKARLDEIKNKLFSGMDIEAVKDAVIVGAYHLESGIKDFSKWSELMVKQHGEDIKPYLQEIWGKSQQHLKEELMNQTQIRLKTESEETKTKPRQFIRTVAESEKTTGELKGKAEVIKPEDYTVQPNTKSLSMAEERINKVGTDKAIEELKGMKIDLTSPWGGEVGARIIGLAKKLEAEKNFDKAIEVIEEGDRIFREGGRLIQAASLWNKLSPEGFLRWANKQIGKLNEQKGILDSIFGNKKVELNKEEKARIIEEKIKINTMSEGIEKTNATIALIDSIAKKVPPTISELIDAYRYQNMLSGWQTQERNIGNNILNTVITRPAVLTTKGMIDYVKSTLFGKERIAYVKDVPIFYKHAINAIPNAIEAFKAVWNGTDPTMLKPDIGIQYKTAFEQARLKQIPKYLTVIQRLMEASDKFNISLISAGEYAIKLKEGISPEQAFTDASAIAQQYLYRNKYKLNDPELSGFSKVLADLGYMIERSRDLPVLGTPMKWIIPFIRTPINVGILATELSPLGLLRTKGFTPEVKAKIVTGSIITAIGSIFAMQDKTTWTTPTDPKSKEMFYATGRKPFSVEINGKYIPLWYLGPFALAFALPAAIKYYTVDQKKALTKDSFDKLIDIAAGIARFIGSQSSTQSIGTFFNLLAGDIDYTFPGQLGFTAGQLIPASGLLRNINKILDPVYRDPEGYWEPIKKDLPFLSNDIPAHTTPMGEESKREWWNALLPYEIGKENEFYNSFYDNMMQAGQIRSLENDIKKKMERGTFDEKDLEDFLDKLSDSYNK